MEGAGVVRSVGTGVTQVKPGDVVAYCSVAGSYAEQAVVPASRLIKMPDGLDAKSGAAAHIRLTLTTSGSLRMELLDLSNEVVALGASSILLTNAEPGEYVVRVLGDGVLQVAPFDLRLELLVP